MSITIQGLNSKQRALADIIWSMNGRDQVASFIRSLSTNDRKDAETVLELMIAAVFDEIETVDQAKKVLDKFRI